MPPAQEQTRSRKTRGRSSRAASHLVVVCCVVAAGANGRAPSGQRSERCAGGVEWVCAGDWQASPDMSWRAAGEHGSIANKAHDDAIAQCFWARGGDAAGLGPAGVAVPLGLEHGLPPGICLKRSTLIAAGAPGVMAPATARRAPLCTAPPPPRAPRPSALARRVARPPLGLRAPQRVAPP